MTSAAGEVIKERRIALIAEMIEYAGKGFTPESEERQILLACLELNSGYMKRGLR